MQAAERLFTTRRVHEITMDDVAAAARVAKGTLYNHFRDKDDLFFQTCVAGFDELCELLESRTDQGVPFQQQLLDSCREISHFYDRRRQLLRMMQAEDERMHDCRGALRNRWMLKRHRLIQAVGRILARGIEEGIIRNDLPGEILANVLMGMLRARSHGLADAPEVMRSHEVIVELFCNGAGAPASAGRAGGGDRRRNHKNHLSPRRASRSAGTIKGVRS
jgi:TetR/AcrR family fatty acid metabolism transcriptional regulator